MFFNCQLLQLTVYTS